MEAVKIEERVPHLGGLLGHHRRTRVLAAWDIGIPYDYSVNKGGGELDHFEGKTYLLSNGLLCRTSGSMFSSNVFSPYGYYRPINILSSLRGLRQKLETELNR